MPREQNPKNTDGKSSAERAEGAPSLQAPPSPRVGWSGTVLLQAVARGHAYGFDLMDATGFPSGTVYPLLRRLEARGLVRSRWERAGAAHGEGRPRRRYYEITALGESALRAGVELQRTRQIRFDELLGRQDARSQDRRGSK
jgi:PadR family transcriptional regulator, regulatory protein PadR